MPRAERTDRPLYLLERKFMVIPHPDIFPGLLILICGEMCRAVIRKDAIVVCCNGYGVSELPVIVLTLFPLDTYVEHPVSWRIRTFMRVPSSSHRSSLAVHTDRRLS